MDRPPDPQLIGFLEAYDRYISDVALALREIILDEAPDASESIYRVYTVAIWFGFSGKMKDMFCYITAHAGHVNLGFPRGAALADPSRVLEGEGKTMRHIKLASLRDVERPFVRRYVRAAMEQAAPAGARNREDRGQDDRRGASAPVKIVIAISVGRTSPSALDLLVRLFTRRQAGQEAGRGPGGPPHNLCS